MSALRLSELGAAIVGHLRDNPADGNYLVQACMTGMNEALERSHERAGRYSVAMLCALTLADTKRMSADQRDSFLSIIANNISGPGLSEIERRFATPNTPDMEKSK